MPNYVIKSLHKFQHTKPRRAQYESHQWMRPDFGATKKLSTPLDTSPLITEEQNRRIQQILGTLPYYARIVDCTLIPYLNTIAYQ